MLKDENVDWCVYGTFSGFHIFTNPDHDRVNAETINAGDYDYAKLKKSASSDLTTKLRVGMLTQGVDVFAWPGGPTSAVHTDDDLEQTVDAFRSTLRTLKDEGDL